MLGVATILDVFQVSQGKSGKLKIFGSKTQTGSLISKEKFQVIRNDEILAEDLSLSGLKHHKKSVGTIEKGQECGISFNPKYGVDFEFQRGDIIECYEEVETG